MATDHAKHMSAVDTLYRNVFSLASNTALITALANDIGYDSIFSWQLEQWADKRDVLVVFSVSGRSQNIISAVSRAKEMGMYSIAITGEESYITIADVHIEIPATNYGICEDIMSILQHAIAQYVRQTQMSDHAIQSARF
jgi:phosphoheptose isomerase